MQDTIHSGTLSQVATLGALPITVVEPGQTGLLHRIKELWLHRELVYFLMWRDIKVRYKQTVLGASWAVIQPFMSMVVFSLFFGRLASMPSDSIPYPLFNFAALVPWTFFANGLTHSSDSLVMSQNLIKKVYFPRLAIPLATVISGVVDFLIAFAVLILMMAYYGSFPTANLLLLPLFVLLAFATATGVGLWLSALNVEYRDVRYVVPFLVQFWMFATPIVYPSSLLPLPWRTLYGINPMAGVVEGFRWALLGTDTQPGPMIIVSVVVASAILLSGALHFVKVEQTFADLV